MNRSEAVEGLYDLVVDEGFENRLDTAKARELEARLGELDPETLPKALAMQLLPHLVKALEAKGDQGPEAQVELANQVIELLAREAERAGIEPQDLFHQPPKRLLALIRPSGTFGGDDAPERPQIPLTSSDLLVNGPRELRLGSELRRELQSADRVDLLCAFLKYSGISVLLDELEDFLKRRPGKLRVITTTYMGATEKRALDKLHDLGADIRISYSSEMTRLHAKAWMFHRDSGFSTAFIGSSNLSAAALLEGLEWNVRLSAVDNPNILERFETTFEQYWDDVEFESYDPEEDAEKFEQAVSDDRNDAATELLKAVDIRPYPHQREILEDLAAEREAGHYRNLVVSASGTGKTVVSALDYKRLRKEHGPLSLLFVAHRQEILEQSRATFRATLNDASFGEYLWGGQRPGQGDHVFATIQSLHEERLEELDPEAYDVVIVDEFHHAAAPTYERFLEHVDPDILLGLTATPERADGQSVLHWFDDRIASEIRLWQALDRGLLCPFRYFGVADETDLSSVSFTRGSYNTAELEDVLTGNDMRAKRIVQAVEKYVSAPMEMRALGFCVTLDHAEMMAEFFNDVGLPSVAVAGAPPTAEGGGVREPFEERDEALRKLRDGEICCIFTVDLFNEGVDVPSVDTVLFLRPTESATIFLQQLGRGLRHAEGKSHLTVLDFIGNAHKRYRFDLKYRAIVGGTRSQVRDHIEEGFPSLPPGCEIKLDRQSQEYVLDNIQRSIQSGVRGLSTELADLARHRGEDISLAAYLDALEFELGDLYSRAGRSWTDLRRRANLPWPQKKPGEDKLLRGIPRLQHVDDRRRIGKWREWLEADEPPDPKPVDSLEGRLQLMLLGAGVDHQLALDEWDESLAELWRHESVRRELLELFDVLEDRLRKVAYDLAISREVAVRAHATYSLAEVMAGFGIIKNESLYAPREGVYWDEESETDLLFVTLDKSEEEYSPDTMYRDYPVSEKRFHWESQHMISPDSSTGHRYIHHDEMGTDVVLFVRHQKKVKGLTQPYLCLGKAHYVEHESERPMQILWELEEPMPAKFYQEAKTAAG